MVSITIKNRVLEYICSVSKIGMYTKGSYQIILKECQINIEELKLVMYEFEEMMLIEKLNIMHDFIYFHICEEAYTYLNEGGFRSVED